MSKGRVLVIDDDEWVCRLLAVAMKEAGFEITITENAADGFYRAVEEQPDCIVCDVDLPDHNGYWVAKKIRSHPSRIATAPFVFLSGLDDREHRLEGFQVGGDAYLTKPFRIDEVVAQVDALIQMAARLRKARQTLTSVPPPNAAMLGDLAQMSVGTLLTLLDLDRRSGVLELKSESQKARISIVAGSVVGTTIDDLPSPPLETIRRATAWATGKFSFTPSEERTPTSPDAISINALLMEAARLEDEERAAEGRPSSSRVGAWKETVERATQRPFGAGSLTGTFEIGPVTPRPSSDLAAAEPTRTEAETASLRQTTGEPPPLDPVRPFPTGGGRETFPAMRPPAPQVTTDIPKPPETPKPVLPPAISPGPPGFPPSFPPSFPPGLPPALPPGLPPALKPGVPPATRPQKPPLPGRTGFSPQLRSLSPSRGIRSVTAPISPKQPSPQAPIAKPIPPPAPSASPDSLDEGWSTPPRAPSPDDLEFDESGAPLPKDIK